MTREDFIKQIEQIEKFRNELRVLSKILCRGRCDFGYYIIQSHIENIAILSGISTDIIESYLYEDKGVWIVNGKEVKIESASVLWDVWHK